MRGVPIAYTNEMIAWLKLNETVPRKELTQMFNLHFNINLSIQAIQGKCKRMGLRTGRTGCFEIGSTPFNAGTKGVMKANETSFKSGSKPHNWNPIGAERISKDGYLQRKITDTGSTKDDFVEVHRLLWESINGKIPDGHIVIFIDGNKSNIDISNLELVSRSTHAVRCKHGYYGYPVELRPQLDSLIELRRAISKARNTV